MNILIACPISKRAVEKLKQKHDVICAFNASEEQLISLVYDIEIIIFRNGIKISPKVIAAAPKLKFLIGASSGSYNLDIDYAKTRGLQLIHIPNPGSKFFLN